MKVLFLHLPKTAGQSVHQLLLDQFSSQNVCPGRINEQYEEMSVADLEKYQVFSGHIDWSRFDAVDDTFFTFTILRDPLERLLSFYFYLREQADIFEARGELDNMPGVKAARQNTPYEFFISTDNIHRAFIDQTLDNLYTYYFSGRQYSARNTLRSIVGHGKTISCPERLVDIALLNMTRDVDAVYSIKDWRKPLQEDLTRRFPECSFDADQQYAVNKGQTLEGDRLRLLRELGADDEVVDAVHDMCRLDYLLLEKLGLSF